MTDFSPLDFPLPERTGHETVEQRLAALEETVPRLLEALQYTLANLGAENFNAVALSRLVSPIHARIDGADGVNAASIVAAINNGGSSVTLSADKIDLNGITTVADTLHIGSENSLERKYLIFHKSGAVISATRGDVPELKLSAGKIDLCGTLYHNGQPLDL